MEPREVDTHMISNATNILKYVQRSAVNSYKGFSLSYTAMPYYLSIKDTIIAEITPSRVLFYSDCSKENFIRCCKTFKIKPFSYDCLQPSEVDAHNSFASSDLPNYMYPYRVYSNSNDADSAFEYAMINGYYRLYDTCMQTTQSWLLDCDYKRVNFAKLDVNFAKLVNTCVIIDGTILTRLSAKVIILQSAIAEYLLYYKPIMESTISSTTEIFIIADDDEAVIVYLNNLNYEDNCYPISINWRLWACNYILQQLSQPRCV